MDSIKKAKEVLAALATTNEEKASARSSIKVLKDEIKAARKSGKTWKEIATALQGVGVKTTPQAISSLCSIKKKSTANEKIASKKETKNDVKKPQVVQQPAQAQAQKKNVNGVNDDGSFTMPKDRNLFK